MRLFSFFLLLPALLLADMPEAMGPGDFKISFFKTLGTITVCLVAIFVALLLFKRLANKKFFDLNQQHHIKIIERRPISQKSVLYLIQVGNEQILIAESQIEVRSLSAVESQDLKKV